MISAQIKLIIVTKSLVSQLPLDNMVDCFSAELWNLSL